MHLNMAEYRHHVKLNQENLNIGKTKGETQRDPTCYETQIVAL